MRIRINALVNEEAEKIKKKLYRFRSNGSVLVYIDENHDDYGEITSNLEIVIANEDIVFQMRQVHDLLTMSFTEVKTNSFDLILPNVIIDLEVYVFNTLTIQ